jgi:capsular exopolysaccharide synthesis family protein
MTKSNQSNDQYVNLKAVFAVLFKKWHWYLLSIALLFGGTFVFNKVVAPTYSVYSSIYIKETSRMDNAASRQFMQSFDMFDQPSSFNNEILVLQSTPLIRQAAINLHFDVSYYREENFVNLELYKDSPFFIQYDSLHVQPLDTDINLVFDANGKISVSINASDVKLHNFIEETNRKVPDINYEGMISIDEEFIQSFAKFKVFLREGRSVKELKGKKYSIQFHSFTNVTHKIRRNLSITPENANVSVVKITLANKNYEKAIDFVEELTNLYLAKNLDRKNHMALNTIAYIEEQLEEVSDSLGVAESKLEDFRSSNEMINISTKAGRVFEQLQQAELEKSLLERQFKYYEYLDEYFNESNDLTDLVVPSSLGVNDETLNQLIRELIAVVNQRNDLISKKQEKSPYIRNLEVQIENLKRPIEENIRYNMSAMKRTLTDLNSIIYRLQTEVKRLPKTERQLVGIERKFQLNDAIYTFLLERRAEAQIARASNLPEHEIVEPAQLAGVLFPNTQINYVAAGFLSLLFPSLIIWLFYFIDDRIKSEKDLDEYRDKSFLGTVINNHYKDENVVIKHSNSAISESFRSLRTNLSFVMKGGDKKVVLVTSCIANEGKSFISLNLATSMAILSKKTLLLGFDLRKENPYGKYLLEETPGLTSYYVGEAECHEICAKTNINNLDIISPGIIPPNPLELIGGERTKGLFEFLRNEYDCIIVDSPPIGIVSDGWLLMDHSDINMLIVRESYSKKHILDSVLKELEGRHIEGWNLLLNASKLEGKKYKYSYYNNIK